jgi:serine/threonine protein kinase
MTLAHCSTCGATTTTAVGELCGRCLFRSCVSTERKLVGEFELFHELGEGGSGVVHLAEHVTTGELVALKIAKQELLDRPGLLALFRQQAKVESSLQHPNIVHVRGVGTHEGLPYLVMPLLEGGTLADEDNVRLHAGSEARLRLMLTIGRAVQYAHERGILHCDLKHDTSCSTGPVSRASATSA